MTLTEIILWLDLMGLSLATIAGVAWVAIRDKRELDQ